MTPHNRGANRASAVLQPALALAAAVILTCGPLAQAQPVIEERTAGTERTVAPPPPAASAASVELTRHPLPQPTAELGQLLAGLDGRLWFLEPSGSLTRFDPQARRFDRVQLATEDRFQQLLIDKQGRLWLAGRMLDYVGVLDPGNQRLSKVALARYPGLRVARLAAGSGDTVWFSAADRPALGRLGVAEPQFELHPLPGWPGADVTNSPRQPSLIVTNDGAVWLAASDAPQVARFDPASGSLGTLALPFAESRADQLLALGDRVAVIDRGRGMLGLLDPRTGAYLEYPLPLGGDLLAASDGEQRVWLVTVGRDAQLVSFEAGTRRFTAPRRLGVAVDGGAIVYAARDQTLWLAGAGHLIEVPVDNPIR